ncbi:MAG: ribosome biogenesis GTPase Der [Sulfobacillus sp.]
MVVGLVALVGRPNVGKSSLFNRLTQTRRAIVEDFPGVTRDRLYEDTDWNGMPFTVVDTGGLWTVDDDSMLSMTRQQTNLAIQEADVIVFVVDGKEGITAVDLDVADLLRRSRKPVVVAVNKAESSRNSGAEFYEFGLGEPVAVSAVHGTGVGDLLDRIVELLPEHEHLAKEDFGEPIRIAIAGRPNVGKSSLLNALIGYERTLVTPIAGTTRDVVDATVIHDGQEFLLLDTAGLRRPNKISEELEEKTVQRTLAAIRETDVVLLMLAANETLSAQDQRIAGQVALHRKAVVVLLNKADLVKGTTMGLQENIREQLKFMPYAVVQPISVMTGWHLDKIWPQAIAAYQSYTTRLGTHALNQLIQEAIHLNPPPTDKGRAFKIYYVTQVDTKPPHIVFFVNDPELLHFSYERYLENRLREKFGFLGSPIHLSFRARTKRINE